ncbi:hypothetical protein E4T44_04675 [Aureobasidium sp. EXF-8845]|nr:hypothetical protein E4T44_04675 [Aureobasidium sp. EXF-8845]KAI4854163.1 hypothetical protein E4T45_04067 [Aureobasidium sp. EXF-8846]
MHSFHEKTKDALPGGNVLKGMIIKVTIMFMALTTFCVFLRLAGKLRTGKRRLVVDDYSMLTAWFFYILLSCLALNVALLERHNPILTLPVADKLLLLLTLGEVAFMLSTIFLKISLMLFYRQFVWKQWQRRAIIFAGGCSIILSLIALFLSLFQCGTLKHIAHRQINGHCVRRNRFVPLLYLHGATGAVTDWAFALLPVTVLIKSSLKPHIKLSVCILLTLGVTGSVAACFRTAYVYGVWFDPAFLDPSTPTTFYEHSAPEIVLALTELGFGISAASLACLQPLLRHFVHKMRNWIHLWFSDNSDHTTGAVRSHMDLLPHVELRDRRPTGTDLKQVQVQACEAPQPMFPPHPAVRRPGIAEVENDINSAGGISLSRRRRSQGGLYTADSANCEQEHRKPVKQRKPSLVIGVLPTITTDLGTEEESDYVRVVIDTPTQAIFKADEVDRV